MRFARKKLTAGHNGADDALAADVQTLKQGFAQLRTDVAEVLDDAIGVGQSGARIVNDSAAYAIRGLKDGVGDVKERGVHSMKAVASTISQHPVSSTLMAFAVGLIAAKLLTRR